MLTQRAPEKELIDLGPDYYTPEEYVDCQEKLFKVNKYLGIFRDTVKFLKRFTQPITVLDYGCGGGLFLLNLSRNFPQMQLTGVDISDEAITTANTKLAAWKKVYLLENVSFQLISSTNANLAKTNSDVILSNLVCHHLDDEALIIFLQQLHQQAHLAVLLNDLHRHRIAYYFYKILCPLLFNNRLMLHDGLISIRKGFTRREWITLLGKTKIKNYQIKWRFPFRWRVILWKK